MGVNREHLKTQWVLKESSVACPSAPTSTSIMSGIDHFGHVVASSPLDSSDIRGGLTTKGTPPKKSSVPGSESTGLTGLMLVGLSTNRSHHPQDDLSHRTHPTT